MALQDLHGRGLSGTVRAQQCEDLPLLDGERQPVHGTKAAVLLAQPLHDDGSDHG
jgi:hypothetical protein